MNANEPDRVYQVKGSGGLGHPILMVAMHAPQSFVAFAFSMLSVRILHGCMYVRMYEW